MLVVPACRCSLVTASAPWEGEEDRQNEDDDHQKDHDEVRDRELDEAPMDVATGSTQIDQCSEQETEDHTAIVRGQVNETRDPFSRGP